MTTPEAKRVRVGVLGTSWWADSMYLPALSAHPNVDVVGLCGRTAATANALAAEWDVPWVSVDSDAFIKHKAFALPAVILWGDIFQILQNAAL